MRLVTSTGPQRERSSRVTIMGSMQALATVSVTRKRQDAECVVTMVAAVNAARLILPATLLVHVAMLLPPVDRVST